MSCGAALDASDNNGYQSLEIAQMRGHNKVAASLEHALCKLRVQRCRRTKKQQAAKPAKLNPEEAEKAAQARQQAEQ